MDTVILKRADHFQTRAVANMGQSRISVASEVSLKNISSWSPVENSAPRFQLTDARRGLFRVDFGHTPDVQVLAPAHRIREMNFPIVGRVDRASAAAMPPSAMTVCAFPRRDLQTSPTVTPAADASIAARSPAPPAPITSTSCSNFWYSGIK